MFNIDVGCYTAIASKLAPTRDGVKQLYHHREEVTCHSRRLDIKKPKSR